MGKYSHLKSLSIFGEDERVIDNDKYYGIKEGKLIRIYAKKDIKGVVTGGERKGGLIEKESNLSSKGKCWVAEGAKVYANATVKDDVIVEGEAEIFGSAVIEDRVYIIGRTKVFGGAIVKDDVKLFGRDTRVYGRAIVGGEAEIGGRGLIKIHGKAKIDGDTKITKPSDIVE